MTQGRETNSEEQTWRAELVSVVAMDHEESARHRKWLADRERRGTIAHRKWIEGVMEKDREIQRGILSELQRIRRLLEHEIPGVID